LKTVSISERNVLQKSCRVSSGALHSNGSVILDTIVKVT